MSDFAIIETLTEPAPPQPWPRLEGELWRRRGDHDRAEACLQRAIEMARARAMRAIELRAATSLARVWQARGDVERAVAAIRDIRDWFTEGRDLLDWRDADSVLASFAV